MSSINKNDQNKNESSKINIVSSSDSNNTIKDMPHHNFILGRRTLTKDLMLGLFITILIALTLMGFLNSFRSIISAKKSLRDKMGIMSDVLSEGLSWTVWNLNIEAVDNIIRMQFKDKDVSMIAIRIDGVTEERITDGYERFNLFEKKKDALEIKIEDIPNEPAVKITYKNKNMNTNKKALFKKEKEIKALDSKIGNIELYLNTNTISSIRIEVFLFTALTIFITISLVIIVTLIILNKILKKPFKKLIEETNLIANGDYSVTLDFVKQYDMNNIILNINKMVINLRNVLSSAKDSATDSKELGENLSAYAEETFASIQQINDNITHINQEFLDLNKNIGVSSHSVEDMTKNINALTQKINIQSDKVELSTDLINKMLSSIDNMSKLTQSKKEAIDSLIGVTKKGEEKVLNVNNIIYEISNSVDDILKMINIIDDIAEQTNTLAINASIEASRQGEKGSGFSIIATQIRELASNSSSSANEITKSLNSTVEKIEQAINSSNESGKAFLKINSEVKNISEILLNISKSMQDLETGNEDVLKLIFKLSTLSQTINSMSNSINNDINKVDNFMEKVNNISSKVTLSIDEITNGIEQINLTSKDLSDLSTQNSLLISNFYNKIDKFKTT